MDINGAFPSDFLKAADLRGRSVQVTISYVEMKDIGGDHKPVVYFEGKDRGLVLNKTNAYAITQMYSAETNNWSGCPVTLYPTETDFQGKVVPCIRVRAPGDIPVSVYVQQRASGTAAPVAPPAHPAQSTAAQAAQAGGQANTQPSWDRPEIPAGGQAATTAAPLDDEIPFIIWGDCPS